MARSIALRNMRMNFGATLTDLLQLTRHACRIHAFVPPAVAGMPAWQDKTGIALTASPEFDKCMILGIFIIIV